MTGNEEADILRQIEEENEERAERVAGSHLMAARCVNCGGLSLAVEAHVRDARCGTCTRDRTGAIGTYSGPYTVPVGYPLGADLRPEPKRESYPDPRYAGPWIRVSGIPGWRDMNLPEWPKPCADLIAFARVHGWTDVRVRYTRGDPAHSTTGKPTALSHLIAVRFGGNGPNSAVAVYVKAVTGGTWTWKSVWVWGPELLPFGESGVTELKEWLSKDGKVWPDWYAEIVRRKVDADVRKKQKMACDAGRHPDVVIIGGLIATCRSCENEWQDGEQPWRKPKKAREHA